MNNEVIKRLEQLQKSQQPRQDHQTTAQRIEGLRYIRKRKNLSWITELLATLQQTVIKPGQVIDTRQLAIALGDEVNLVFDRKDERGDDTGPTRALGDLIGGHGLCLRKVAPSRYLMPTKLPIVQNDRLIEEAQY